MGSVIVASIVLISGLKKVPSSRSYDESASDVYDWQGDSEELKDIEPASNDSSSRKKLLSVTLARATPESALQFRLISQSLTVLSSRR